MWVDSFVVAFAMWRPDPAPQNAKIGFTTYAMWGLCFVVIGVCYALEANETGNNSKSAALPADVHKVLPSGAYLMSARLRPARAALGLVVRGTSHRCRVLARRVRLAEDGSIQKR